ncbi:hypothetical protein GTA08_BOTSDO09845 [Botryosphaeria dothidea]|uniref:Uncharacterized protein n=1 Tax=Botryosphaeria dothidea TaxID=55169 RepID=A0A8H4IIP4_9PEZI|nr:hypothetical protein GTA08_BOTSDO09845 [Botryosphaeria dothidea]
MPPPDQNGLAVRPQTIGFMDLSYGIRLLIYKELSGPILRLLCLSKEIHIEVKLFIYHLNLCFARRNGFLVLGHFLHSIGASAIKQLQQITVHTPFLTVEPGENCSKRPFRPLTEYIDRLSSDVTGLGLRQCDFDENFLSFHADTFRDGCRQLAAANGLRKLEMAVRIQYPVKNGTMYLNMKAPKGGDWHQQFPDEAYWRELQELGRTLPDLEISLVLVHVSVWTPGENFYNRSPHILNIQRTH